MTRSTRKRIFYSLVLAFFVIGGIVISYAEGWRFDFTNLRTEQVGAIYVRSFPKEAQITLNNKSVDNKSGFLSAGTLISNLKPGHYTLSLKEQGYLDWTEAADVLPTLVTEFKYAVLVPQNATSAATTSVQAFFLANGAPVIEDASGTVSFRGKTIGRGDLVETQAAANPRYAIIKTAAGSFVLYDLSAQTSTRLGALANITVDPYDQTSAIVANQKSIVSMDLGAHTSLTIASSGPRSSFGASVAFSPAYAAWSRAWAGAATSEIVAYDKFLGTVAATSSVEGSVTEVKWISNDNLGIVTNDGSLYVFRVSAQTMDKLADNVKDFYPTDDGNTIAALEHKSIEILPIGNGSEYYRFNPPDVGSIKSLSWYEDKTHLFLEYPDHVSFLDFTDTSLHNLLTVSNGTQPFYDARTNTLYLIDQGQKLIRFDFPS